jgi:hypothetical protein
MMNSRAARRRAAVRHTEGANGNASSFLRTLAGYWTDRLAHAAMKRVNRGVHEIVRRSILHLVLGWIGTVIVAGGFALLLAAGVTGLEALHYPPWLAFLVTGVLSVAVGVVAMKGIIWPRKGNL